MQKLLIYLVFLGLLLLVLDPKVSAQSDVQIVFSSDALGTTNIFVMNPDGSDLRNLEDSPQENHSPDCSRDGNSVAFTNYYIGFWTIDIMNSDGSNRRILVEAETQPSYTYSHSPTWSPDGTKIAFASRSAEDDYDLYTIDVDGSNMTKIISNDVRDTEPAWAPDDSRIAFVSRASNDSGIFTANTDGSNIVQLTNSGSNDNEPSWSPDSSQIVFQSDRDGNDELYVMDSDGNNVTRLTNDNAFDGMPSWSPDGSKIAFVSDRHQSGNFAIYTMNPDGTNIQLITPNSELSANSFSPCWLVGEPLPSLSIASATGAEGTTIRFIVTLDSEATGSFTVDYNVTNVTTSSEDFVGDVQPSGTLTFNGTAGEQQFIDIATANDDIGENGEFFLVQLTNVIPSGDFRIGVTPSDVVALGTITDSDPINPDVNGDGLVTPADAVFVINRIGEPIDTTNAAADVDGDGEITNDDALKVIMRLGETLE